MSSSRASSRTCSICGASNSPLSLFCAECGSALNDKSNQETGAIDSSSRTGSSTAANSSQQTEPFTPAASRWSPDQAASVRTPSATGTSDHSWHTPATSLREPPIVSPGVDLSWADARHESSQTGFVLGVLATLLIIGVIALFVWASLLDPDTRDTISGWFDFIG